MRFLYSRLFPEEDSVQGPVMAPMLFLMEILYADPLKEPFQIKESHDDEFSHYIVMYIIKIDTMIVYTI